MKTKAIALLELALIALNRIPNHSNVGPNNESSYDVASSIATYLRSIESSKDNPVPSLTKEEVEYLNDNLLLNNTKSHIGESILKKLNGVETNKEQPKCNKCEFNGDYMDAKCKHCGKPME